MTDKFEEVKKPWGSYKVVFQTEDRVVKIIKVSPGERLSLQSHRGRRERWMPISGSAVVSKGHIAEDASIITNSVVDKHSSTIFIDNLQVHRLSNPNDSEFVMLEIQEGDCDEEDIVRYQDDYGRTE